MKPTDTMSLLPGRILPTTFAFLLLAAAALGQATQEAATSDGPNREETVQLSMFEVTTSRDIGYQSTNAAEATRMDTPIENVPMNVTIFNQQFIDDLVAIDTSDLLLYEATAIKTTENDGFLARGSGSVGGFVETGEERGSHPYGYHDPRQRPTGGCAPGAYEPDALTDRAVAFLRRHRDERFFLFLSHYYVHDPVNTRCEWLLRKYREKAAHLGVEADDTLIRYVAFVEVMDHLVGRVLAVLDELGLTEDTVVIFTSDNGGAPQYTDNGRLRGSKWTLYEGGIRVPLFVRWAGVTPPGNTSAAPVVGMDIFPTLAEIAEVPLPENVPLDGVSLRSLLADPSTGLPRDTLIWHFPFYHPPFVDETPASALRRGTLELVYHYEGQRLELFDLSTDPGETTNLGFERFDLAAELRDDLLRRLVAMDARFPRSTAP